MLDRPLERPPLALRQVEGSSDRCRRLCARGQAGCPLLEVERLPLRFGQLVAGSPFLGGFLLRGVVRTIQVI